MSKKRDIYNEMDSEEQNDVYAEDYPSYYEEEDGVPVPEEDEPADDPMQYPDDLEGAGYFDDEAEEEVNAYEEPMDFYFGSPRNWLPMTRRGGSGKGKYRERDYDYSSPSSSSETSSSESSSDSSSEEEEDDDSSDTSSSEEETTRGRGRRKVTRRAKAKTGRKTMRSANRTSKKRAPKKTNKKRR